METYIVQILRMNKTKLTYVCLPKKANGDWTKEDIVWTDLAGPQSVLLDAEVDRMPQNIPYDADLDFCKCGKARCPDVVEYLAAVNVAAAAGDKKDEAYC